MNFFKLSRRFQKDEDGAVTVDWVVLTAAIVGLGIAVLTSVRTSTESITTKITSALNTQTVKTTLN